MNNLVGDQKTYLVGDQKIDQFSLDDPQVLQDRDRIELPISPVIGLVT